MVRAFVIDCCFRRKRYKPSMWIEWKKYKRNNDAEDDGNDLHNQDKGNCLIPYLTLFFMPNWFFFTIIHSVFFFIKLPSPFRMTIHRIVRSIVMIRWYVCTATRIAFFHIWLLVFFRSLLLSHLHRFVSFCFAYVIFFLFIPCPIHLIIFRISMTVREFFRDAVGSSNQPRLYFYHF